MSAATPVAAAMAIAAWRDALSPAVAADSAGQLDEELRRRGLVFGNRPLCTVLRPRFLTPAQWQHLVSRGRLLLRALDAAWAAAMADSAIFAQFRPEAWEAELVGADPGRTSPNPLARLDAFLTPDGSDFSVTEYNGETPAGAGYSDALAEVFLALPATRRFLRTHVVRPLPARHLVLHALLEAWEAWSGSRRRPAIAIVDWKEVPTRSEFVLFHEYFQARGFRSAIADPGECEYRNGRLLAQGEPVDLVYKRVLLRELVERGGEGLDHPIVRAVRDGAVCLVNGFRCKLLHKKASLAVLSDERNARLFGPEERAAIARHVPWTRLVEERTTRYCGAEVDLVPFILAHRERLVLKPNDDYGGKGVVLGWEADQADWEAAVQNALAEPYVVQERVAVPVEPFPAFEDNELRWADRLVDTAPFTFAGARVDSCLTRISTASLVNVTAGSGSTVPTFIVEPRT
jgi:uncharacterized circularly permuted ATP-grasp superfamily protein